jgi:hypothetical protein
MSTATLDMDSIRGEDDTLQYRALHTGALIGLVLGLLSVFVLITATNSFVGCLMVAPIPIVGIVVSLRALGTIRRHPEQYAGGILAQLGLLFSVVFLMTGVAYGAYVYVTELPDGYERISFGTMKPDELQERSGIAIPPELAALNGKKIFIKGYIRPGSSTTRTNINRFLLVRDNNQCCFGDITKLKYYDQMEVQITNSNTVSDNLSVLRMGGILEVHPENLEKGPLQPVYSLRADYAAQ